MDVIEALLYSATQDALVSIGEPMRQAFLWHLHHEGIRFSHRHMDFDLIVSKLRQFFGVGSDVIIQKIYENFVNKAMIEGYFTAEMIPMLDMLPKNPNLEKILQLVIQEHKT